MLSLSLTLALALTATGGASAITNKEGLSIPDRGRRLSASTSVEDPDSERRQLSSASTAGELVGSSNSIQLYIQNHLSSPIFAMAEIVALYAMGELPQSSDAAGAEDAIRKLLYAKVS